ncbi:glycosyltransferase family 2 protein [Mariniflexile sp.]|uniref:glycosyltransferase family 2 protein n=1 Tax=Mariniflexile sp. TaxID=1979402 RepID=UPI004047B028
MPLVSIVIPCYNDAQYIEQAVNSALAQTYSNKEIIVVDDGSNFETKRILDTLKDKVDKILTQENQGVCVARNTGIEAAKGNLILVLDSDDFFEPEFLIEALTKIKENNNIGLVTCWSNVINTNGEFLYVTKPTGSDVNEVIYNNNAMGSCLFKKETWREVGGYDLQMKNGYEDWEFNVSVACKGYKIAVIEKVLFNYRLKKNSRNTKAIDHQKDIRKYVFTKHKDIAIRNYDKTIRFFLDEIEKSKIETLRFKNSNSYKLGHFFFRNLNRIKSFFK